MSEMPKFGSPEWQKEMVEGVVETLQGGEQLSPFQKAFVVIQLETSVGKYDV